MDIEYHYYMTYLIARKAGFDDKTSYIIGYASQYVDDNTTKRVIEKSKPREYRNYISQTSDILKPKEELLRVYSRFHFLPGNPSAPSARRKDGKMHLLNTTPDSKHAKELIKSTLKAGDLYQIGIASHTFSDTWAHQNFVGYKDGFNSMDSLLGRCLPNIGHADATHNPDIPAHIWNDDRLFHPANREINNTTRFLSAAGRLFQEYRLHLHPRGSAELLQKDRAALRRDLKAAMEGDDNLKSSRNARIREYQKLGEMPKYNKNDWYKESVKIEKRRMGKVMKSFVKWRSPQQYKRKHWVRFQEAVKAHQALAGRILEPLFEKMKLEKL